MSLTFVVALLAWAIVLVFISFKSRVQTGSEFASARGRFSPVVITTSIVATLVGPGFSLGAAHNGFVSGFTGILPLLGYAVGAAISGFVVAPFIASNKQASSLADVIDKAYGKLYAETVRLSGIIVCIIVTSLMVMVCAGLLSAVGFSESTASFVVLAVIVAYTMFGGMVSSILTDFLQATVFILVMVFLAAILAATVDFSVSNSISNAPETTNNALKMLALGFGFAFGEIMLPPYAHRTIASADSRSARKAFLLTSGFVIVWLPLMAFIGIGGRKLGVPDAGSDTLMAIADRVIGGKAELVIAVALFGILMSTADSLLQSAATDISSFFATTENETNITGLTLSRMRMMLAVSAVLSWGLIRFLPGIIDSLMIVYTIWAPVAVLPLIYLSIKKGQVYSRWSGLISGSLGGLTTAFTALGIVGVGNIPPIVLGLFVSGAALIIAEMVSFFRPQP
jgi:Na+/proline symporter